MNPNQAIKTLTKSFISSWLINPVNKNQLKKKKELKILLTTQKMLGTATFSLILVYFKSWEFEEIPVWHNGKEPD